LGAIVTVLAIAVAVLWVQLFLDVRPADEEPTPSPVVNTATPTISSPTATSAPAGSQDAEEATPVPEATGETEAGEQPTQIPAEVDGVAIGVSVTVAETGVGLNLRAEPVVNPDNILALVPDGTVLEVVDGPREAEGYTWWQVRASDGTEGWAVTDFLIAP
jgi:hypothetical protein